METGLGSLHNKYHNMNSTINLVTWDIRYVFGGSGFRVIQRKANMPNIAVTNL